MCDFEVNCKIKNHNNNNNSDSKYKPKIKDLYKKFPKNFSYCKEEKELDVLLLPSEGNSYQFFIDYGRKFNSKEIKSIIVLSFNGIANNDKKTYRRFIKKLKNMIKNISDFKIEIKEIYNNVKATPVTEEVSKKEEEGNYNKNRNDDNTFPIELEKNYNHIIVFKVTNGNLIVSQLIATRTPKQIYQRLKENSKGKSYIQKLFDEKKWHLLKYYFDAILDKEGNLKDEFLFPLDLYKIDISEELSKIENRDTELVDKLKSLISILEKNEKLKKEKLKRRKNNNNKSKNEQNKRKSENEKEPLKPSSEPESEEESTTSSNVLASDEESMTSYSSLVSEEESIVPERSEMDNDVGICTFNNKHNKRNQPFMNTSFSSSKRMRTDDDEYNEPLLKTMKNNTQFESAPNSNLPSQQEIEKGLDDPMEEFCNSDTSKEERKHDFVN